MTQLQQGGQAESLLSELGEIARSMGSSFRLHDSLSRRSSSVTPMSDNDDNNEQLWAAVEMLPTSDRERQYAFDVCSSAEKKWESNRDVDVRKLGALEKQLLIDKLIKHVGNDNRKLLQKQTERLDRVNVTLPTIEVRYMNLCVEAECDLDRGKNLPTLWNAVKSKFSILQRIAGLKSRKTTVNILKDVSGIIKPSRLTLLLGPPQSGKTILLQALAGRLDKSLKVSGEISYNGFRLEEFVPQKTSVYISQYDQHFPEMTVRETLDFSARLLGVGSRAETMKEVLRREKQTGIIPEPDIDTYMKAISEKGLKTNLQTDYTLKILGLDICADTIVGDAMRTGISGGQKKRLTIGEMLVGPSKTLFMDEISNGLDSSTTYQTVNCIQQLSHITNATVLVSLLQPAPEIFELFDDIILMSEGKIVYHGPRTEILNFFEECGFRCPERKDVADFLQEVLSRKNQEQYWYRRNENYSYFTVDELSEKFKLNHIGQALDEDLLKPYDKTESHKNALSFKNSFPNWEILKACMSRELLLMKRNLIVYVFKTFQLLILAIITMTVFLRTRMKVDVLHANYYLGSLFMALMFLVASGAPEMPLIVSKLPNFYKQRDMYLYPAWAYAIPASILKIPISLIHSLIWTSLTYYVIGYSPEAVRYLRQFLLFFLLSQMQLSVFRSVASFFQSAVASATSCSFIYLAMTLFCGFILPLSSTPAWLKWGFWSSPLAYAEIGLSVNEFLAPRWQEVSTENGTVGQEVLRSHGLDFKGQFYWISVAALFGFTVLFNAVFALCLTFKRSLGKSQYKISQKKLSQVEKKGQDKKIEQDIQTETSAERNEESNKNGKGRIVLPFVPLAITFQDVRYYVDIPPEMREQSIKENKLQLLHDITGAFRPGVLSALMGVSGAGKTTLLDVLAGRKTGGTITGQIKISGYPKVQETFSRISGYCEQSDIHSPHITVKESLLYSAMLRLPADIKPRTRCDFVRDVLETIELSEVKDALVGILGISGLCTEQRKRLTIAVELVANPSILFMDEPTTGLDAQAAATVMHAIKNVAETGRTIVCTIHQPSTDIFEAFNEIILMKKGGEIIYSGPLGQHSSKAIEYFENIPGVPRMRHNCNPATWMLEVTSTSVEEQLGIDFAHIYKYSNVYRVNKEMVDQLSIPPPHSMDLNFPTRFSQNGWEQFRTCLWKQHLSYWRTPSYILVRIIVNTVLSVILAALFWKHGKHLNNQQDLFNMLGLLYIITIFPGINSCAAVQPFVAIERIVLYRERFAGMYSPWAYSLSQVVIEIPYALLQVALSVVITYRAVGLVWSAFKFFWFFYAMFCTLLYFIYLGMLVASLTPNLQVASIISSACYNTISLFSGFMVPGPQIPKWWIWLYYSNPLSWTLNGIFSSQYGDVDKEIIVFGETKSIASFLPDYFGFHRNYLGLTAVLLMTFPLIFASLFAYCIGKINFQRR